MVLRQLTSRKGKLRESMHQIKEEKNMELIEYRLMKFFLPKIPSFEFARLSYLEDYQGKTVRRSRFKHLCSVSPEFEL